MFGKHLVDRGPLTEDQLIQALDQQQSMRPSIGRLAFQEGYLTLDQVVAVIDAQAKEQRDSRLERQRRARLPLGQVLASMGLVPADALEAELNAHLEARASAGGT